MSKFQPLPFPGRTTIEQDRITNPDRKLPAAPSSPSILTLELTTVCNNFCSGCANVELSRLKKDRKNNIAYMKRWREIIDIIAPNISDNPPVIRLSGGEPTLHPEFEAIVDYLELLRLPHALLTTGRWTKLRTDQILKIYGRCSYTAGMLISLHGSNQSSHSAFVESIDRAFGETCSNIKSAARSGVTVFTNTVLTKFSCMEIEDIVLLAMSLGAKCAVFNRFIGDGHHLQPAESDLLSAIQKINQLQRDGYPIRLGNSLPKCFASVSSFPVISGYELCHIAPDGRVRPDNFTPYSFGNLLQQSLSEIWNSEHAHAYRNHFPLGCSNCAALSTCRGGVKSPYFRTAHVGDSLMKSPLSMKGIRLPDDKKDKKQLAILALTSD